jgi:hypothetical protein
MSTLREPELLKKRSTTDGCVEGRFLLGFLLRWNTAVWSWKTVKRCSDFAENSRRSCSGCTIMYHYSIAWTAEWSVFRLFICSPELFVFESKACGNTDGRWPLETFQLIFPTVCPSMNRHSNSCKLHQSPQPCHSLLI